MQKIDIKQSQFGSTFCFRSGNLKKRIKCPDFLVINCNNLIALKCLCYGSNLISSKESLFIIIRLIGLLSRSYPSGQIPDQAKNTHYNTLLVFAG